VDTALQIAALTVVLASGPIGPTPPARSLLTLTPATRAVIDAQTRAAAAGRTMRSPRARRRDSVLNGLLIGAAAGFVASLVASRSECGSNDAECEAITRLAFVPVFTAGGAGVGALLDHFTP
jgi:hypothetical protein